MITRVAIKKDDVVYVGGPGERHCNLLCCGSRPFGFLKGGIQGFIDELGTFYNRRDAAKHAYDCGQLPNDKICPNCVISEDLW